MHAQEQHARVETVDVARGEDVFVCEVWGWEEEGEGDAGIEDDGIGVEPTGTREGQPSIF